MEALKELGLRASVFMSVNWDNPMGLSGLLEGQSHTKYGHHPYPLLAGLVQRSPSPSPFLPTPAPSLSLPLPHRPGPWKILWPRFSPLWAVTVAGEGGLHGPRWTEKSSFPCSSLTPARSHSQPGAEPGLGSSHLNRLAPGTQAGTCQHCG